MSTSITRKQFVQGSLVTALVAAAGCAADDGEDENADSGEGGDCGSGASANIATNHGHTGSVPAADITAGAAKDYDIAGSAGHSHTISVTAEQMSTLAAGASVMVTSSSGGADGHTHAVTLLC